METRICPQCYHSVPASARFCPECAKPILPSSLAYVRPEEQALHPDSTVAVTTQSVQHLLWPCAIAALVILTLTAAVLADRLHQEKLRVTQLQAALARATTATPSQPAIAAPISDVTASAVSAAPATVTNPASAPAVSAPAATISTATLQSAPVMPGDMADYLKFLQAIEVRRVALQHAATSSATPNATAGGSAITPSGAASVPVLNDDLPAKWQALVRDFHATTAPASCTALAADYGTLLDNELIDANKVGGANTAGSVGTSVSASREITLLAQRINDELGQLCTHYNAAKPFVVTVEGSAV